MLSILMEKAIITRGYKLPLKAFKLVGVSRNNGRSRHRKKKTLQWILNKQC
jgi:hypothetical protein